MTPLHVLHATAVSVLRRRAALCRSQGGGREDPFAESGEPEPYTLDENYWPPPHQVLATHTFRCNSLGHGYPDETSGFQTHAAKSQLRMLSTMCRFLGRTLIPALVRDLYFLL